MSKNLNKIEYKYIIVNGWFHPKNGGDDYPFTKGFKMESSKTLEDFRHWFEKNKNQKSAVPSDYQVEEVTKEKWFTLFD